MAKFQRKSSVVDAFRWTGANVEELTTWLAGAEVRVAWPDAPAGRSELLCQFDYTETPPCAMVTTQHGPMPVSAGSWIARDRQGQFASWSAEAFEAIYEPADQVCFYGNEFYVLSNFSAFTLRWRGHRFDTSEAAYQWEKFFDEETNGRRAMVRDEIRNAGSAHEAFKIAQNNDLLKVPTWGDMRVDVMRDILRAKVEQHSYVRKKLLETGDRILIEDSWRDSFWGWGPNRDGQNMLGHLWMEIRAQIRPLNERSSQHASSSPLNT